MYSNFCFLFALSQSISNQPTPALEITSTIWPLLTTLTVVQATTSIQWDSYNSSPVLCWCPHSQLHPVYSPHGSCRDPLNKLLVTLFLCSEPFNGFPTQRKVLLCLQHPLWTVPPTHTLPHTPLSPQLVSSMLAPLQSYLAFVMLTSTLHLKGLCICCSPLSMLFWQPTIQFPPNIFRSPRKSHLNQWDFLWPLYFDSTCTSYCFIFLHDTNQHLTLFVFCDYFFTISPSTT